MIGSITGVDPIASAGRLLREHAVTDTVVPVTAIARGAGLRLRYVDLPEDPDVHGFIDPVSGTVAVNAADRPEIQMTTIAHQLGLWVMHRDHVLDDRRYAALTSETWDAPAGTAQADACMFASELLMPGFLVERYHTHAWLRPGVGSMARIFGVTDRLVRMRLGRSRWPLPRRSVQG